MGRVRPKHPHKGIGQRKKLKGRNRVKDLDEVYNDIQSGAAETIRKEEDLEKPGDGKYYCTACSRYFIDQNVLGLHNKTKPHKRRVKELKKQPYTQAEAEWSAGMAAPDNGRGTAARAMDA